MGRGGDYKLLLLIEQLMNRTDKVCTKRPMITVVFSQKVKNFIFFKIVTIQNATRKENRPVCGGVRRRTAKSLLL
jgi:hypothetical protein